MNFDSDQAIAGGNPGNPLTGYIPGVVVFGNGNGAFTEKPAFGSAGVACTIGASLRTLQTPSRFCRR